MFHALAAFHHVADFGLQAAHFCAGFIEQALALVHFVRSGVMRLAHLLEFGLDMAHIGHARFQCVDCRLCIALDFDLLGLRFGAAQKPNLVLLARHIGLHGLVLLRDLGLALQFFQTAIELAQNVFHPRQVGTRVRQAVFGLAAALFVFRNARGLFQKQTQLFGLGFNNAADSALADDGVGARPQAGAQKNVLHVAATHCLVVDVVARGAVACQDPAHGNFGELAPLTTRAVVGIVKHQFHTGAAGGLARGGAVKDHILHGLAAQFAGATLTQNPAYRVHDVGLATAIRPHHPDQLARQQEIGGFDKRLETRQLDGIEAHRDS